MAEPGVLVDERREAARERVEQPLTEESSGTVVKKAVLTCRIEFSVGTGGIKAQPRSRLLAVMAARS